MGKYDAMTQEDFDRHLIAIVNEQQPASSLLTIPGIYEVLAEHFNNEVLESWEAEQEWRTT
jgi:hypothetical protein